MWWLHAGFPDSHPFPEPDSVLIAEANKSCELQNLNKSCCSLLYWTYHVSWEKNWREDDPTLCIFARGTLHIFARGIKICKYFSECRARAQERASAVVWVLSPAFRGLSLVLHEIPVANFCSRFLPLLWIMLVHVQGPSPTSQGLSLSCCLNFCHCLGCLDLAHCWSSSAPFGSPLAICKVGKLPSCILFVMLSSTLRIAHLLVKGFCMFPKFPVPDCKF